jgi:hypothetical protein
MIITDVQTINDFLEGKTKDYRGRTFQDMLDLTDIEIERCHDQIQWMFPLHEKSKRAHTYPIVTKSLVEKMNPTIITNLMLAKVRMEKFYGLGEYEDEQKQSRWCKDRDHNLLRITRIIRCLRLFGMEDEATDFYDKVSKVADRRGISPITLFYWEKAYTDRVWNSLQD